MRAALADRLGDLAMAAGLAVLLYAPYLFGGLHLATARPRGDGGAHALGTLFVLFGRCWCLRSWPGPWPRCKPPGARYGQIGADALVQAAGALLGIGLVLGHEPTLGFLVATLALWTSLLWTRARGEGSPTAIMAALLTCIGLGSILVPEVIYLRDSFQSRMNTVFKFYYDAWILLALAAPLLGWELAQTLLGRGASQAATGLRALAAATLAITLALTAAGAVYPVAATMTKSGGFAGPATLDGMSYLRSSRPDDVAAIEWLKRNHPEARRRGGGGNDYTDAARISTLPVRPPCSAGSAMSCSGAARCRRSSCGSS